MPSVSETKSSIRPEVAFIVGCSRSGTTILGDLIGCHPQVANWYEPYFIWDWHHGSTCDDYRDRRDVSVAATRFVRREFKRFQHKARARLVIDKTPEHAFKIDYIRRVFPGARWIHILRDGRDTILSLHREWQKRSNIVENFAIDTYIDVIQEMLTLQPFWRNRLQAIWFELKNHGISLNLRHYFNKAKWQGASGYGPRFPGWEQALAKHTALQFNALQWVAAQTYIFQGLEAMPSDRVLTLHYEDLLAEPDDQLRSVLTFLDIPWVDGFYRRMRLLAHNTNKWRQTFSSAQLAQIGPIISSTLESTGYASNDAWWQVP